MTLPLAFVKDFGWATIPATLLTSYILFGVEEIGVEIEDPFERTVNDLPIQSYCQGIDVILSEICDESRDTALRLPFENHNS
jgi:putative membrane protein